VGHWLSTKYPFVLVVKAGNAYEETIAPSRTSESLAEWNENCNRNRYYGAWQM
jgi:hypothetical protein